MKRNTVRLCKYISYVIAFIVFGPGLLRFLFRDSSQEIDPIPVRSAHGLPEPPEEMRKVCCFVIYIVTRLFYYLLPSGICWFHFVLFVVLCH